MTQVKGTAAMDRGSLTLIELLLLSGVLAVLTFLIGIESTPVKLMFYASSITLYIASKREFKTRID